MRDRRYGSATARAAADAARNRRLRESGGMQVNLRLDPEHAGLLRQRAEAAGIAPTAMAGRLLKRILQEKSMKASSAWEHETLPTHPGWYAILFSWSEEEGLIPDAARWDNGWLREKGEVLFWNGPFDNEQSALTWSDEHDD